MSTPAVPFATGAANATSGPITVHSARRRGLAIVLFVLAVGCLIPVVPLFRHGIAAHAFPSYVEGASDYQVERYSAPWIAGAVALAGVALILLLVAVGRLRTRVPVYSYAAPERPMAGEPTPPTSAPLEPLPTEAAREY